MKYLVEMVNDVGSANHAMDQWELADYLERVARSLRREDGIEIKVLLITQPE